ncbi:UDP-N-acetylenolpyruvoylglucosamine reductase [Psittacicella hinzii]|uniref:UDP-N-acetylenolpyruvoylglucosamine reductase n=1 Tax=Psittacicella hinzii TaxID=2028575 RepID=A0A3A1Y0P9_9GAMM|nr:UDP-N-acetylmuramate dehydrogenase [Psittacicella hinzii]RIY31031.1 UDP-N-acetylenolpyruvoylglucosamine reductase [Psittacicella hinzii]
MTDYNRNLTTFRIPITAKRITTASWPNQFLEAYQYAKENKQNLIILGQGSNTLFVEDFDGEIIINQYKGITLTCNSSEYLLKVNSGVTIDELIAYCHRFKVYGLENLASIPSSVGTAAIGNIGAYGVEFEQFVDKVTLLNLENSSYEELTHDQLDFSYRNSILKSPKYRNNYFVVSVTLKIPRLYKPVLTYAPLNSLDPLSVTPQEILNLVVSTRKSKLPDYNEFGNGGSFFLNPVVSFEKYNDLKEKFDITGIILDNNLVKLSAAWLIENSGLKGTTFNRAQVSLKHSLVLGNMDEATGNDIANLASLVQKTVFEKFGITLTPEIRFIASSGEVDANLYLKTLL